MCASTAVALYMTATRPTIRRRFLSALPTQLGRSDGGLGPPALDFHSDWRVARWRTQTTSRCRARRAARPRAVLPFYDCVADDAVARVSPVQVEAWPLPHWLEASKGVVRGNGSNGPRIVRRKNGHIHLTASARKQTADGSKWQKKNLEAQLTHAELKAFVGGNIGWAVVAQRCDAQPGLAFLENLIHSKDNREILRQRLFAAILVRARPAPPARGRMRRRQPSRRRKPTPKPHLPSTRARGGDSLAGSPRL